MRIIISPAKKMARHTDDIPAAQLTQPLLLDQTERLLQWMRSLTDEERRTLWATSERIAAQSGEQLAHMDLHRELTPALLAFEGIQYTYMAPAVFEDGELAYVQEHLRILSGFYGALRPMDGVVPYRLEMQAKGTPCGSRNLYEFWGDSLYRAVMDESHVLVNLASKEYARAVERYLSPSDSCVSCTFGELTGGRVVQKGVYVKMARGEMMRYLAGIHAEDPREMQTFSWSGYAFDPSRSTETNYVFVREPVR